jgi:hypothetical protein
LKYHDFIIAEDYSFDITYSLNTNDSNFKKNNLLEDTKSSIFNECTNDCQGINHPVAVTVIAARQLLQVMDTTPVMDVLAASTYVAGMANCGYSNKSCLRGC